MEWRPDREGSTVSRPACYSLTDPSQKQRHQQRLPYKDTRQIDHSNSVALRLPELTRPTPCPSGRRITGVPQRHFAPAAVAPMGRAVPSYGGDQLATADQGIFSRSPSWLPERSSGATLRQPICPQVAPLASYPCPQPARSCPSPPWPW
jgi:hypothetical protein